MAAYTAQESARMVCERMGLSKRETQIVMDATKWCPGKSLATYLAILRSYARAEN